MILEQEIYDQMDQKLRASPFQSGVSEAHGLLAGLACRGIPPSRIGNRMHLMKLGDGAQKTPTTDLISGLFELIIRDLDSTDPTFNLLLPQDAEPPQRIEQLANWCGGYMQGFCHDSDRFVIECSRDVREVLDDIMTISNLDVAQAAVDEADQDRSLSEIEEYLRVGIQLIYDELVEPVHDNLHSNDIH